MADRTCSVDGCSNPHLARGWCNRHYHQWKRHGDPLASGKLTGPAHPNWKGDEVSYKTLHQWVYRHKGRPGPCEHCGDTETEWANRSQEYRRDIADWLALCRPCHRTYDRKSTCRRGHEMVEANTYIDPRGYPQCRECSRIRGRKTDQRRRAAT